MSATANKLSTVVSAGVGYDPGNWFAPGEWTQSDSRAFLATRTGWYLSGGIRIATQSAGVRWDFCRNLDLKLQADHTRLDAGSHGTLVNVQPGFRFGGTVNLFSAAIDFVY